MPIGRILDPNPEGSRRIAYLRSLVDAGETVSAAARKVFPDLSPDAARSKARRALSDVGDKPPVFEDGYDNIEPDVPAPVSIPAGDPKRYDDFPRLRGDFLLLSDLHVPYHDHTFISEAVTRAVSLGIRKCIVVGDLMDGNQWNKRGLHMGFQRRWQDDAEIGAAVVDALASHFEELLILSGNHDAWFVKHFKGHADAQWLYERLFRSKDNVTFTHFEQAHVVSGGKDFRVLHGANYSGSNPLGVASSLSAKFESGIVMGHQHHHATGFGRSGRQTVCLGGMFRPEALGYVHESPRTNPVQTCGYAILADGWVRDYPKGMV